MPSIFRFQYKPNPELTTRSKLHFQQITETIDKVNNSRIA